MGNKAANRMRAISSITRIKHKQLSFTYLGVPIFNGRMKALYFEHIIETIRSKLAGWKARIYLLEVA